jgi:hypothetical protein
VIQPPPADVLSGTAWRRRIDVVITRDIRDFVSRDWAAARRSKDTYWGERIARLGLVEGLRIAGELRQQALWHDPSWPHADERQADLHAHVRLSRLFRRAGAARRP